MPLTFHKRWLAASMAAAALSLSILAPSPALAQAGPPMVTDDPDTPGDGHWEINMAATGARSRAGRWDIAAPDLDINYGWGEHIQLKLDVPWAFASGPGLSMRSGLGRVNVGVKWRFVDEDDVGYAMSIYPQYQSNWVASSKQRGITPDEDELFLPLEVATRLGGYGLAGEVGRSFTRDNGSGAGGWAGTWVLGGVLSHGCGEQLECQFELHKVFEAQNAQTLVNFGLHWKLNDSWVLLGSAGRETGPRNPEQLAAVFYVGLQWVH